MKGIKKSVGAGISILLLLCFSVAVLPVDFFHDHFPQESLCKDSETGKSCQHSVHISSKKSFCWICAIHVDTPPAITHSAEQTPSLSAARLLLENEITGFVFRILFPELRGPPQN